MQILAHTRDEELSISADAKYKSFICTQQTLVHVYLSDLSEIHEMYSSTCILYL